DHDVVPADVDAARLHDRFLAPEGAAGKLVRLADAHDFLHPFHELELARVDGVDVSDHAEDGVIGAGGAVDVEAARGELGHDVLDVRLAGVLLHDDDHWRSPIPCVIPSGAGNPPREGIPRWRSG